MRRRASDASICLKTCSRESPRPSPTSGRRASSRGRSVARAAGQHLAEELLGAPAGVDVRRVDEVDARPRTPGDARLGLLARDAAAVGEPGAEADLRDLEVARAEPSGVHVRQASPMTAGFVEETVELAGGRSAPASAERRRADRRGRLRRGRVPALLGGAVAERGRARRRGRRPRPARASACSSSARGSASPRSRPRSEAPTCSRPTGPPTRWSSCARTPRATGSRCAPSRCAGTLPEPLLRGAPWDLVLGADLLYEARNAEQLAALLPLLGGEVLLAEPGRPFARGFLERLGAEEVAVPALPHPATVTPWSRSPSPSRSPSRRSRTSSGSRSRTARPARPRWPGTRSGTTASRSGACSRA